MPTNEAPKCQHIKTNGTECGSPALKDNQFCYYHQHCRPATFNYRGMYHDYTASEIHLPVFEDVHAIQFTLRQVTELIMRHKIDAKEAGLLLYALQIASSNLKRLKLDEPQPEQVVIDAAVEHAVETPEEAAHFSELQIQEIERIYSCADDAQPPFPVKSHPAGAPSSQKKRHPAKGRGVWDGARRGLMSPGTSLYGRVQCGDQAIVEPDTFPEIVGV